MSSKQLARTVVDGKAITFRFVSGEPITGYLCGMDDFHWMVITSSCEKHLIHKGSASIITMADVSSYEQEPDREALESIVGPFRNYVASAYLGRAEDPARDERAASTC